MSTAAIGNARHAGYTVSAMGYATPCWLWNGPLRKDGYPRHYQYRRYYEHFRGPIPEGLTIDHLCRVRHCVNPDHMEPVTRGENVMRGEGVTAQNARKTQCPKGHAYSEENTYWRRRRGRLGRVCRRCEIARVAAWKRARREAVRGDG